MTFEEFCVENGKKTTFNSKRSKSKTTHGMSGTRLYKIWSGMKIRTSAKAEEHNRVVYFDRGITVCEEWQEFYPFLVWSYENGYAKDLTIDRIDVNGNYCPENCRWVSLSWQNNNKQCSRKYTYNGEEKTIGEWEHFFGMPREYLRHKIDRGYSFDTAVAKFFDNDTRPKHNTSGMRGISYDNTHHKWRAYLAVKGKRVLDRVFFNKEDAVTALEKAKKEHGITY